VAIKNSATKSINRFALIRRRTVFVVIAAENRAASASIPILARQRFKRRQKNPFVIGSATLNVQGSARFWEVQAKPIWHKRGIDARRAAKSGVTFAGSFLNHAAVCFPIRDANDVLVAMQGRYAGNSKWMRTVGPKKLGVFATEGAWEARRVAIVEAPIDALSFAQMHGIPAIAVCGSSLIPDWVFRHIRGDVELIIAGDADEAGERAGDAWETQCRGKRRRCSRMRPKTKDWNADLVARAAPLGAGRFERIAEVAR
jgi:hypothetical protein